MDGLSVLSALASVTQSSKSVPVDPRDLKSVCERVDAAKDPARPCLRHEAAETLVNDNDPDEGCCKMCLKKPVEKIPKDNKGICKICTKKIWVKGTYVFKYCQGCRKFEGIEYFSDPMRSKCIEKQNKALEGSRKRTRCKKQANDNGLQARQHRRPAGMASHVDNALNFHQLRAGSPQEQGKYAIDQSPHAESEFEISQLLSSVPATSLLRLQAQLSAAQHANQAVVQVEVPVLQALLQELGRLGKLVADVSGALTGAAPVGLRDYSPASTVSPDIMMPLPMTCSIPLPVRMASGMAGGMAGGGGLHSGSESGSDPATSPRVHVTAHTTAAGRRGKRQRMDQRIDCMRAMEPTAALHGTNGAAGAGRPSLCASVAVSSRVGTSTDAVTSITSTGAVPMLTPQLQSQSQSQSAGEAHRVGASDVSESARAMEIYRQMLLEQQGAAVPSAAAAAAAAVAAAVVGSSGSSSAMHTSAMMLVPHCDDRRSMPSMGTTAVGASTSGWVQIRAASSTAAVSHSVVSSPVPRANGIDAHSEMCVPAQKQQSFEVDKEGQGSRDSGRAGAKESPLETREEGNPSPTPTNNFVDANSISPPAGVKAGTSKAKVRAATELSTKANGALN